MFFAIPRKNIPGTFQKRMLVHSRKIIGFYFYPGQHRGNILWGKLKHVKYKEFLLTVIVRVKDKKNNNLLESTLGCLIEGTLISFSIFFQPPPFLPPPPRHLIKTSPVY